MGNELNDQHGRYQTLANRVGLNYCLRPPEQPNSSLLRRQSQVERKEDTRVVPDTTHGQIYLLDWPRDTTFDIER